MSWKFLKVGEGDETKFAAIDSAALAALASARQHVNARDERPAPRFHVVRQPVTARRWCLGPPPMCSPTHAPRLLSHERHMNFLKSRATALADRGMEGAAGQSRRRRSENSREKQGAEAGHGSPRSGTRRTLLSGTPQLSARMCKWPSMWGRGIMGMRREISIDMGWGICVRLGARQLRDGGGRLCAERSVGSDMEGVWKATHSIRCWLGALRGRVGH